MHLKCDVCRASLVLPVAKEKKVTFWEAFDPLIDEVIFTVAPVNSQINQLFAIRIHQRRVINSRVGINRPNHFEIKNEREMGIAPRSFDRGSCPIARSIARPTPPKRLLACALRGGLRTSGFALRRQEVRPSGNRSGRHVGMASVSGGLQRSRYTGVGLGTEIRLRARHRMAQ